MSCSSALVGIPFKDKTPCLVLPQGLREPWPALLTEVHAFHVQQQWVSTAQTPPSPSPQQGMETLA